MSRVQVTVRIAFNNLYPGDTSEVEYDDQIKAWESRGLVSVSDVIEKKVTRGTRKARPRTVEPADTGSVTHGAGDSGTPGDEQGEGFGAGGYGTSAGQHPH